MTADLAGGLADPDIQEHPEAYYHALRAQPVFHDTRLGFYICSDYRLLREVLRDTERFSSIDSQRMDDLRTPPEAALTIRRQLVPPVNTLVTNDPPDHTRIRRMVDAPFRPRSIETLRAGIVDIVNQCIDAFISRGTCEVVSDYAIPIPVRVIADMLGIDRDMAPKIKEWSDASVEPLGMMVSDERLVACARLMQEFQAFMISELEARQRQPRDDLLSHLTQARDDSNEPLTLPQMLSLTQQFLVAGNETTTNGIAAGVQLLIAHPDQQAILRQHPERLLTFTNEVLRLEAPVQGLFRIVTRDTELGGVTLPAGARLMLRFAAANRDPGKYTNPDDLDVWRHNTGTHVAFGAGIHHCIGANLAREEMTQAFGVLLERTRNLAFRAGDNDFAHHPSMILRGLKRLHITFDSHC
ncbi:MAG: cytochrome P450 [Pseudomonadales bacterium]|nr:cytochrome P450 [Pseudomonadales bacterium]MCP5185152.1 cytochrome P450 [Pseudomonadales bacterium]